MAIKLKFDESHNVILPTLVLATRNGNKLGVIPAYNLVLKDTLQVAEMSFKVNKVEDGIEYALWNKLVDFKLAWVREWDTWFEIYVELDESNELVKCVTAKSLGEAELSQINLYGLEINTEDDILRDDYEPTVFYDDKYPDVSLLNRLLYKAPHYKIDHVDLSLRALQRTFSFDGDSILDAFQTISEEIGCIFDIDSGSDADGNIARVINVYDLESYCLDCDERGSFLENCSACGSSNILTGYGDDTTIFISTENLADNITYSTDVGSVKNCFKLEAGDDLMTATIINCNPNGTAYIWYISDDMKEDMSDALVERLAEYDAEYEKYQMETTISLSSNYLTEYNNLVKKYASFGIPAISGTVTGYVNLMNAYYDTIDFNLLLNHTLMPNMGAGESTTTAKAQVEILNRSTELSPSLLSTSSLTVATATNAVLSIAKTLISPDYQLKAINTKLTGSTWSGELVVTSYRDENDFASTGVKEIAINDDRNQYMAQRLSKSVSYEADGVADIVALFKMGNTAFKSELTKYCLSQLQSIKACCQGCLNILTEQAASNNDYNGLYNTYYSRMGYIDSEIAVREHEISVVVGTYDNAGYLVSHGMQSYIQSKITAIQDNLNFEKYLGNDLWLEFAAYRREDTYKNDNYISDGLDNAQLFQNALEFYNIAKKEIFKSATLQHSISATVKNLLVMREFAPIVDSFALGNWIRASTDGNVHRLRLIEYEIDFDDLTYIPVVFSDVIQVHDGVSDVESILNQASAMSSSYGMVAHQAGKGSKSGERLDNWVNKGLALTNMKIINDVENQNVTFDDQGLSCKEYLPITEEYDDRQLKLINRGIYFTDDGWKTCKVGIGNFAYYDPVTGNSKEAYGVIADTLVGNLILSETVGVYNKNGSIVMDKDGFVLTSDKTGSTSANTVFTIQSKKIENDKEVVNKLLYIDDYGDLVLNGTVKIDSSGSSTVPLSDAFKVATNYLSFDSGSGLIVGYKDSKGVFINNRVQITSSSVTVGNANASNNYITSNGMYVRSGTTPLAQFTLDGSIIGKVAFGVYNTQTTSSGIYLREYTTVLSSFEAGSITLGDTSEIYTQITAGGMTINQGNTVTLASFTSSSAMIGKASSYHTIIDSYGMTIEQNGSTLASYSGSQIVLGQTNGYNTLIDTFGMSIRIDYTKLAQFSSNGVNLYQSDGDELGSMTYEQFSAGGIFSPSYGLLIEGNDRVGIGVYNSDYGAPSNKLIVDYDTINYRGGYSTAPWAVVNFTGFNSGLSSGWYNLFTTLYYSLGTNYRQDSYNGYSITGFDFDSNDKYLVLPYSGYVKVWGAVYVSVHDSEPKRCSVYIYKNGDGYSNEVASASAIIKEGIICISPRIISVQDSDTITMDVRYEGESGITIYGQTTNGTVDASYLAVQYL